MMQKAMKSKLFYVKIQNKARILYESLPDMLSVQRAEITYLENKK